MTQHCRKSSTSLPGVTQSYREQNCLQAACFSKQSQVRILRAALLKLFTHFKEDNGTRKRLKAYSLYSHFLAQGASLIKSVNSEHKSIWT